VLAGSAEAAGAIAGTVVGKQGANADAVAGKEVDGRVQEADGGFGLLIGEDLGEGHAGVIVDGHVQGDKAGMFAFATEPAIAAQADLRELRHALDIEMQEVAGCVVLVALHGWGRVQVAPSAQPGRAQDTTDRGRTDPGAARDLVAGDVSTPQLDDLFGQAGGQAARAAVGSRTAIQQPLGAAGHVTRNPLTGGLGSDAEGGCSRIPLRPLFQYESD